MVGGGIDVQLGAGVMGVGHGGPDEGRKVADEALLEDDVDVEQDTEGAARKAVGYIHAGDEGVGDDIVVQVARG